MVNGGVSGCGNSTDCLLDCTARREDTTRTSARAQFRAFSLRSLSCQRPGRAWCPGRHARRQWRSRSRWVSPCG